MANIEVSFEMVKQSTECCRLYGSVLRRHRNAGFPTENAFSTSKHNDRTCTCKAVGSYQETKAAPMYDAAATL